MKVYSQRTMNYELELAIGVLKILVGQFINDQFTPRNKAMFWGIKETVPKTVFWIDTKTVNFRNIWHLHRATLRLEFAFSYYSSLLMTLITLIRR